MEIYSYNRFCSCLRCRCHGLMGGVVLIMLGVLFLFSELHVRSLDFERTWPLLLIAIGLVLFAKRSASMNGHVPPTVLPPPVPAPPAPPAPPDPNEVHHG